MVGWSVTLFGRDRLGRDGGVAQMGEHLLCKQGVVGSIPSTSRPGCLLDAYVVVWREIGAG